MPACAEKVRNKNWDGLPNQSRDKHKWKKNNTCSFRGPVSSKGKYTELLLANNWRLILLRQKPKSSLTSSDSFNKLNTPCTLKTEFSRAKPLNYLKMGKVTESTKPGTICHHIIYYKLKDILQNLHNIIMLLFISLDLKQYYKGVD